MTSAKSQCLFTVSNMHIAYTNITLVGQTTRNMRW